MPVYLLVICSIAAPTDSWEEEGEGEEEERGVPQVAAPG